jgi:transcription termination factor Rho
MLTVQKLGEETLVSLKKMAAEYEVKDLASYTAKEKDKLIYDILKASSIKGGFEYEAGILELVNNGSHGFIRVEGVLPSNRDIYVSNTQIQKFNLKTGDVLEGVVRPIKEGEKYRNMLKVDYVSGVGAVENMRRLPFEKRTAIFPNRQLHLETTPDILSTRIIDLLSPIGYGQRSMVVSPPKAGKTTILKDIANGITANHPDVHIIVVLVGERPEEVTDMQRSVKGEVYASNFDEHPQNNVLVAEMALERAKRLVEMNKDVVILMDSITRLARAYNLVIPSSGRTLSGGFDPAALYPPKRFFGAARNFEEGGSLTIIATALVNTGSKMDDLIYEEFKGTGNMELHLDRSLGEKRIYPAIDVVRSGTRREDLLLNQETLQLSWLIRRMLDNLERNGEISSEVLIERMKTSKSNAEFMKNLRE